MPYSERLARELADEAQEAVARLRHTLFALAKAASAEIVATSKEHLQQGAGRRLGILAHCVSSIFEKFPTSACKPLPRETLYDVQIAHHAFVINLYGYFENLAWAFVLRHDLEQAVGGRKGIGLFLKSTKKFLPEPIAAYLNSPIMTTWHDTYLKNYRDALAHRVPLYIPPATLTPDDVQDLQSLRDRESTAILESRWDLLEELRVAKLAVGQPSLFFAHSYADNEDPRPIYLHPQVICDAMTVVDFTPLFLSTWHERA